MLGDHLSPLISLRSHFNPSLMQYNRNAFFKKNIPALFIATQAIENSGLYVARFYLILHLQGYCIVLLSITCKGNVRAFHCKTHSKQRILNTQLL